MSATLERPESDVVDLREPTFSIPSKEVPLPPARNPEDVLRRRRRWLLFAVAGIVAVLVLQHLVGILMAGQRQRHLAYEVTTPDRRITPGEAAFVLQIPDIGLNQVVAEGASSSELRGGPGRVIGTAQIADGGNTVVLGRRTRFGAPFGRLSELAKGDVVVAQTRGGGVTRSYTVESTKLVASDNAKALEPSTDRLTLVTSGPGLLPTKRLVVVAKADTPPPSDTTAPKAVKVGSEALDERSSSAVGLVLGVALLLLSVVASVIGIRRLRETYSRATVIQAVLPVLSLLLIVSFVITDSMLPSTL